MWMSLREKPTQMNNNNLLVLKQKGLRYNKPFLILTISIKIDRLLSSYALQVP